MTFSYTRFPVNKINVGKILKLWENRYLIILSIHILKLEISGCDGNRPKDPQDNHQTKAQVEVGPQGVSRPHRLAEPTLCRPILAFHVVPPSWLLVHSRGAHTILTKLSKAYK
jgi:hypothetical protein